MSVRVRVRVRASLTFRGCALKLTLLTVGLLNVRTVDTERNQRDVAACGYVRRYCVSSVYNITAGVYTADCVHCVTRGDC